MDRDAGPVQMMRVDLCLRPHEVAIINSVAGVPMLREVPPFDQLQQNHTAKGSLGWMCKSR